MDARPLALLAMLVGAAPALAQSAGPAPDPEAGRAVAASLCRSCHLISHEDRGPVPDGVPSFVAIAARPGQTEDGVKAGLMAPHPIMPEPPITTQQAADVAAYIMTLRE
jgi:mono/diheme cytochrome c family protein